MSKTVTAVIIISLFVVGLGALMYFMRPINEGESGETATPTVTEFPTDEVESATLSAELDSLEATDSATMSAELEEQFRAALAQKHPDWDMDNIEITVTQVAGQYATITVMEKDSETGGGMAWLYNDGTGWRVIWDGQSTMTCDDADSAGFPVAMVPECLNEETGEVRPR